MYSLSFSDWLNQLKTATSFDLYRLRVLIGDELQTPERHQRLLARLQVGQRMNYFDAATHQQRSCEIKAILKKYIEILDLQEGRRYSISPYMLNIEGRSVEVSIPQQAKLERHHLKVGDRVGFVPKEGQEYLEGRIVRLNQKTVTLDASDGRRWRVGYSFLLQPAIDGSFAQPQSLSAQDQGRTLIDV